MIKEQWESYTPIEFNIVAAFDPDVWYETMSSVPGWLKEVGDIERRKESRQIIAGSDKFLNTGGKVYSINKVEQQIKDRTTLKSRT